MKRKIISIVLIFFLTIMITVDLYKQNAVAVAPAVVLIPAATYAIYVSLAAAGVIGNTDNDHRYLANDYISKISDYEKAQWNAIAKYGLVTGSMLISGVLATSLTDHVIGNYDSGNQVKNIIKEYPYDASMVNTACESITVGSYTYTAELSPSKTAIRIYKNGDMYLSIPNTMQLDLLGVVYTGSYIAVLYKYLDVNNGQWYGPITYLIERASKPDSVTKSINYGYTGDSDGLGVALAAAGGIALSLPSQQSLSKVLGQVEADQALVDWIEAEMNKVNKSNKPNWGGPGGSAAVIAALAATSYYWLDPVTQTITQTTTQTPPPGEDLIPLPAPGTQTVPLAPSLPDNYPTEDNPEIKTKLSDPIITTIDNGDGTHTETKTQEETKTERYYDPDSQKWIEKTTKTKTTTTTDIDDQTGDRTETGRTTETLPDSNTTETPPPKDATDIDWGPLKQGIGSLQNKFPFCLPWDIYNSFVQFQGLEWSGIIDIDISQVSSKFPVGWDFDIDFSMFDEMRQIVKKIELMLFDLGLILATRKLMGGGV